MAEENNAVPNTWSNMKNLDTVSNFAKEMKDGSEAINDSDSIKEDEESLNINNFDNPIIINQDQLNKAINNAVQKVIDNNLLQVLSKFNKQARTSTFETFNIVLPFPRYNQEDKLSSSKNYIVWRQCVELDLCTNCLLLYIYQELGDEDIPIEQKQQLDANALNHLQSTTVQEIANSLLCFKTAYHAFKHLEVYYGGKKL